MKRIKLSGKSKTYLKALGLLALLFVLVGATYKLAVSQIPLQKSKLSAQIKKEQALQQKSELLITLGENVLARADITSFALPSNNPSFVVISQLNRLAGENSVLITNLRVGGEAKEGSLLTTDLSLDIEGLSPSILVFLQDVGEIAPIALIDKIQINQTQETARATVRIRVFWAEFPISLPAISEPVSDLTEEEEEILARIVRLTPPAFVYLEPNPPNEKTDPF